MNLALVPALSVLVLVLCARRDPPAEARTAAQMWDAVRSLGWQAPLRALAGLVAVLGLIAACLSVVLLGASVKLGQGAVIVGQATALHVADLIGWAPVQLREAA